MDSGNGDSHTRSTQTAPSIDQRGGLKMMGTLLIALGLGGGCIGITTQTMMLAPPPAGSPVAPVPTPYVVTTLAVMGLVTALLVLLGTASVRMWRWSAPAIVAVTATWALFGLIKFTSMLIFGRAIHRELAAAGRAPGSAAGYVVGAIMLLVIMVLLPAGFVYFYSQDSVRRTLEQIDPRPAWTDRCPMSVLDVSLWLILGAAGAMAACSLGAFPAFGNLLFGRAALIGWISASVILLLLAWGVYRLSAAAWWATAVVVVLHVMNMLVTRVRVDTAAFYRNSTLPMTRLEFNQWFTQHLMYAAVALAYLLLIRRFLRGGTAAVSARH